MDVATLLDFRLSAGPEDCVNPKDYDKPIQQVDPGARGIKMGPRWGGEVGRWGGFESGKPLGKQLLGLNPHVCLSDALLGVFFRRSMLEPRLVGVPCSAEISGKHRKKRFNSL